VSETPHFLYVESFVAKKSIEKHAGLLYQVSVCARSGFRADFVS
jgi:hypothetical protein